MGAYLRPMVPLRDSERGNDTNRHSREYHTAAAKQEQHGKPGEARDDPDWQVER